MNWRAIPKWFLIIVALGAGTAGIAWAGWVTSCALTTMTLEDKVDSIQRGIDRLLDLHLGKGVNRNGH